MARGINYDYSSIVITEADVDDARVHVDKEKLFSYDHDHLLTWLKFRGDSLKHIDTMKLIQSRVLEYFNNGTDQQLIDPTLDKRYKRAKVEKYEILKHGQLPILKVRPTLNPVPDILKHDMATPTSSAGWSFSPN